MPEPTTQLILENGMVREMRVELLKEVRLADFLPHIEFRPPVTIGILPSTARFIHWDESDPKNKRIQLLAELAPGVRTSKLNHRSVQLSYPWTYFLFDFVTAGDPMEGANWTMTNTRVYWAPTNVINPNDKLYTALVFNCDSHGQICWGTTGVDTGLPLATRVDTLVTEFYRTTFGHSNGAGSPWQSETGLDDWTKWIAETKKNPAAFRDFPEWNITNTARHGNPMRAYALKDVFGTIGDRSRPIEVVGRIPDLIIPMTYGRAEEWLDQINPADIAKLEVAIANRHADAALAGA